MDLAQIYAFRSLRLIDRSFTNRTFYHMFCSVFAISSSPTTNRTTGEAADFVFLAHRALFISKPSDMTIPIAAEEQGNVTEPVFLSWFDACQSPNHRPTYAILQSTALISREVWCAVRLQ